MSPRREYGDYLNDILHYSEQAQAFVAGMDFDAFADNEEKTLAVVHALQIVGEAASKLPRSITRLHPEIPWAKMTGMRNFIVHGYFLVDLEIVWRTVKEDLPALRVTISQLLADLEKGKLGRSGG